MRRVLLDLPVCGLFGSCLLIAIGCSKQSPEASLHSATGEAPVASAADTSTKMPAMAKMAPDPESIEFKDEVTSNVEPPKGLDGLVFFDTDENRVKLGDYIGKKNVVLVFTEGFAGMLCPFCKTQTSRLVANYDKFAELDTEILVVYPGTRNKLDEFIAAAKQTSVSQVDRVPFPLLLDEDFKAVDFFEIRSNLAHPSTYVIDKTGTVRLAYVGNDMSADRPSVAALLEQVRLAN